MKPQVPRNSFLLLLRASPTLDGVGLIRRRTVVGSAACTFDTDSVPREWDMHDRSRISYATYEQSRLCNHPVSLNRLRLFTTYFLDAIVETHRGGKIYIYSFFLRRFFFNFLIVAIGEIHPLLMGNGRKRSFPSIIDFISSCVFYARQFRDSSNADRSMRRGMKVG